MVKKYDKEKWVQEQKEKQDICNKKIKDIAENFRSNPSLIAEFFAFKARFYNYSPRNSILIYSQNPNATFCGSYIHWKKLGYNVKSGSVGLKVWTPVIKTYFRESSEADWKGLIDATPEEKKKIKSGEYETRQQQHYQLGTTFDISQTDCPPEEYPKIFNMGYSSEQHKILCAAVSKYSQEQLNCPVIISDVSSINLRGFFNWHENKITLSDKLNDTERLSTITHELGHAMLHNKKEIFDNKPSVQCELEADAYSIMLQEHFGIQLTESRKLHLSEHYKQLESYNSLAEETEEREPISLEDIINNASELYANTIQEIDKYIQQEQTLSTNLNPIQKYCAGLTPGTSKNPSCNFELQ